MIESVYHHMSQDMPRTGLISVKKGVNVAAEVKQIGQLSYWVTPQRQGNMVIF